MKPCVTSRAEILAAARGIADRAGPDGVNIRAVAAACGVAVGSIYNYFPSKAELLAALAEDFWRRALERVPRAPAAGEGFPDYVGRLYAALRGALSSFRRDWLAPLGPEDRSRSREREAACFDRLRGDLARALEGCAPASGPAADSEAFAAFVFRNLVALLREDAEDCAYLEQILSRLLEAGS